MLPGAGEVGKHGKQRRRFFEEMPEELRDELGSQSTAEVQAKINTQFTELNSALAGLVEEKEIGVEQFFAGIDRLVQQYAGVFGRSIPEYDVKKNVQETLSKSLEEDRKKNSMDDFDWSSLWKKEDESS